jgi:hypothetical protein
MTKSILTNHDTPSKDQIDQVYEERNRLVALLARLFPSGKAITKIAGWEPEWHNCIYIDLPTGQASWHVHESQMHEFANLPDYTGQWDGHTSTEKYQRVLDFIALLDQGGIGGGLP